MTIDPTFFDGHPPRITSLNDDIPERSDYHIVGKLPVKGTDMNRVVDPQYPWRNYSRNPSPAYHKKLAEIVAQRDADVAQYVATRRRFWQRIQRWHYGTATNVMITKHVGFQEHKQHIQEQSDTTTSRIAADLGIDISPGGADVPIPPPVAMAAAAGGGGSGGSGNGGGVNTGLHFSKEMTQTLHITDTDDQTFTNDTTTVTTVTFAADTTYVYWRMQEECILERVSKVTKNKDVETHDLVYSTLAATVWDYTDAFPPTGTDTGTGTGNGNANGGGDIH